MLEAVASEVVAGVQWPVASAGVSLRDLGLMRYADALAIQRDLVERRKRGEIPDQLLIVEHPHVITMGRNGRMDNVLAAPEILKRAGIEFYHTLLL